MGQVYFGVIKEFLCSIVLFFAAKLITDISDLSISLYSCFIVDKSYFEFNWLFKLLLPIFASSIFLYEL